MTNTKSGFAPIIILIIILLATAAGGGSYVVIKSRMNQGATKSDTTTQPETPIAQPSIQKVMYSEPGLAYGKGNYFDLRYQGQGIVMQTSVIVDAQIEMLPNTNMIKIRSSESDRTTVTLMYLEPNKIYYKYLDSYANLEEIKTDASGSVIFTEDTSKARLIIIQTIPS